MSTEPPHNLAQALADLQQRLPDIAKDETAHVPTKSGGGYEYKYANLTTISAAILPLLGELGLSFTAFPTLRDDGQFVLRYTLRHVSGESASGEYPLPTGSPQTIGSAITYGRRYCLCAVTGVSPDSDDDAVSAEYAAMAAGEVPEEGPASNSREDLLAFVRQLAEQVRQEREYDEPTLLRGLATMLRDMGVHQDAIHRVVVPATDTEDGYEDFTIDWDHQSINPAKLQLLIGRLRDNLQPAAKRGSRRGSFQ